MLNILEVRGYIRGLRNASLSPDGLPVKTADTHTPLNDSRPLRRTSSGGSVVEEDLAEEK